MSDTSSVPSTAPAAPTATPAAAVAGIKSAGKTSVAEAAVILRMYESEVLDVSSADEGTVATTKDGQRYLLTADGGYVWLQVAKIVPQLLAGA